jgi:hypothetical protein
MNQTDERILKDLTANFRDKVLRNIADYVDLCARAGLDEKTVMSETMLFLIRLTASFAAHRFNITPGDFAEAVGIQFQHAQSRLEEDE